jgi:hypothetical protein
MSVTAYTIHEFWKYNNEKKRYIKEKERSEYLLKELFTLRAGVTNKEAQKYIEDEIKNTHIPEPPPQNVFFELWNTLTCGFFR